MVTWIYFALIDNSGISIGSTNNVQRRLSQHARTKHDVHDVRLLACVQASKANEKYVQQYFSTNVMPGFEATNGAIPEYFEPSPALTNYIRWLRNQWFTVVDLEEPIEGVVDFTAWMPDKTRQIPPVSLQLFPPDYLEFPRRQITGDDYYTNPCVIECAVNVMGAIDLDPASSPLANRTVKAREFFTIADNGLEREWHGRVWLNAPFSQWALWVPKIISEVKAQRVYEICLYASSHSLNSGYFVPLLNRVDAVCIISGRLAHGGIGDGKTPDRGHCVLYIGPHVTRFIRVFAQLGTMWRKADT